MPIPQSSATRLFVQSLLCVALVGLGPRFALANDFIVNNEAEFNAALNAAADGDRILLNPGTYAGGFFKAGLTGVEILSANPNNRAVINGGTNGIQLSDATRVTIRDLVFQNQTGNGLNIDDGGSFSTPSTDITLRNLLIKDISPGNHDGIKLSGVTGFLIDSVEVTNWGDGGSAIDPVGSHHGLIQNSYFHAPNHSSSARVLGPKGGSKDIVMRANRIEMGDVGRLVQAGGSTGSQFFRFIDGDSGYEAAEIRAEGNILIGGSSSMSFVNIDGGIFHHNFAHRPDDWFIRILNENQGNAIVDTQNGLIMDNVFQFNDTASEFNRAVNIGPETLPQTFMFQRNQWYNIADPNNSEPDLPSDEEDGIYGVPPAFTVDDAIAWEFEWGIWAVNAVNSENTLLINNPDDYTRALPGLGAEFDPLLDDPFIGDWTFEELTSGAIQMDEFTQAYFRFEGAAVPEPATTGLLAVVATGLWVRRRLRRRANKE